MAAERTERKLAAIVAAEIVGYSRLMSLDEEGTLSRLKAIRREVANPKIKEHHGRIVKAAGDGLLISFPSVFDAVLCAMELQRGLADRNTDTPVDRWVELRIGINIGDIIKDGRDIYGEAVNVAARLEALGDPGGIFVSRQVAEEVRDKLALSFEDLGEHSVKNIPRPVRIYRVMLDEMTGAPKPSDRPFSWTPLQPSKPSIAVLPFQNMSGDPSQEYFSDGLVDEIIAALSRIGWLFVFARNSSSVHKGQVVDVRRVRNELGVRYVLEGSVRRSGNRMRITGQLIDALTGMQIWSDRFEGPLDDIFALQDQVASGVAGAIEPALLGAEIGRSVARPTVDMTAYDLFVRALALSNSWEKESTLESLDLLHRAIEHDPSYGQALALAARGHFDLHVNNWTDDPAATRLAGLDLARRAVNLASDDPSVLWRAAFTLAYFGEDMAVARSLVDRSLRLNPNSAFAWRTSAWLWMWSGEPDRAIEYFQRSVRLNPRENRQNPLCMGVALLMSRRFEEARAVLLQSVQQRPTWVSTYRFLACCCAHMGRLEEARETVARIRTLTDVVVPDATNWRDLELREFYLSGLRLASGG